MIAPCDARELSSLPSEKLVDEAILLLKGFADPTRFKLLLLLQDGEVCVHQLVEVLEMSQSAVSHQLRVLRSARLVSAKKRGRHVFYRLADDHVREMLASTILHSAEAH